MNRQFTLLVWAVFQRWKENNGSVLRQMAQKKRRMREHFLIKAKDKTNAGTFTIAGTKIRNQSNSTYLICFYFLGQVMAHLLQTSSQTATAEAWTVECSRMQT